MCGTREDNVKHGYRLDYCWHEGLHFVCTQILLCTSQADCLRKRTLGIGLQEDSGTRLGLRTSSLSNCQRTETAEDRGTQLLSPVTIPLLLCPCTDMTVFFQIHEFSLYNGGFIESCVCLFPSVNFYLQLFCWHLKSWLVGR